MRYLCYLIAGFLATAVGAMSGILGLRIGMLMFSGH